MIRLTNSKHILDAELDKFEKAHGNLHQYSNGKNPEWYDKQFFFSVCDLICLVFFFAVQPQNCSVSSVSIRQCDNQMKTNKKKLNLFDSRERERK